MNYKSFLPQFEISYSLHSPVLAGSGSEASFPCLNSHICLESVCESSLNDYDLLIEKFTPCRRKSAFILQESVSNLAQSFGLNYLGFLTFTFSDHVTCAKEASKRLNSLIRNIIKPRYKEYVGIFERQKSGRIHYHFLIASIYDFRTGVDFDQLSRGDYRSAPHQLRCEWAFWRSTAPKYRFGRTELLPVKSNIDAMAKYVGKYIQKSLIADSDDRDKGVRLVRYSRGARAGTARFQWHSEGSECWRKAVRLFAYLVSKQKCRSIEDIDDLSRVLGNRWAYHYRGYILGLCELIASGMPYSSNDFDISGVLRF